MFSSIFLLWQALNDHVIKSSIFIFFPIVQFDLVNKMYISIALNDDLK